MSPIASADKWIYFHLSKFVTNAVYLFSLPDSKQSAMFLVYPFANIQDPK